MRKVVFILFWISCFITSKAQLDKIEILVGKEEQSIIKYLDSINYLQPKRDYHYQKSISKDGDLVLQNIFAISDQSFYKCYGIILRFQRLGGIEICTTQLVLGQSEYTLTHWNYVKDHFKRIDSNNWKTNWDNNAEVEITANLEMKDYDKSFVIMYQIRSINK